MLLDAGRTCAVAAAPPGPFVPPVVYTDTAAGNESLIWRVMFRARAVPVAPAAVRAPPITAAAKFVGILMDLPLRNTYHGAGQRATESGDYSTDRPPMRLSKQPAQDMLPRYSGFDQPLPCSIEDLSGQKVEWVFEVQHRGGHDWQRHQEKK